MVTPKGNADKLPDEWKDEVVAIIKKYKIAESESVHLYQEVVKLLDRCVTEAVLMNTAILLDDAADTAAALDVMERDFK